MNRGSDRYKFEIFQKIFNGLLSEIISEISQTLTETFLHFAQKSIKFCEISLEKLGKNMSIAKKT